MLAIILPIVAIVLIIIVYFAVTKKNKITELQITGPGSVSSSQYSNIHGYDGGKRKRSSKKSTKKSFKKKSLKKTSNKKMKKKKH